VIHYIGQHRRKDSVAGSFSRMAGGRWAMQLFLGNLLGDIASASQMEDDQELAPQSIAQTESRQKLKSNEGSFAQGNVLCIVLWFVFPYANINGGLSRSTCMRLHRQFFHTIVRLCVEAPRPQVVFSFYAQGPVLLQCNRHRASLPTVLSHNIQV
jgi:hypothetical protein